MIHFNALDFNVSRSEEVIIKFLLTLSVEILIRQYIYKHFQISNMDDFFFF